MTTIITIEMDKKCAECGKGGRAGNGLCLSCSAKALKKSTRMKSAAGIAAQNYFFDVLKKTK